MGRVAGGESSKSDGGVAVAVSSGIKEWVSRGRGQGQVGVKSLKCG